MDSLKIIEFISNQNKKVDFNSLKKAFKCEKPGQLRNLKLILKKLVEEGILNYTSYYGRSNIEVSYGRPIQISQNIILKPISSNYSSPNHHVVSLCKGVSFGGGEHPTTRLCIKLIDNFFNSIKKDNLLELINCIDIGTGSGILAIVAAVLGADSVIAVDNDQCSLYEAKQNVLVNNLVDKIWVENKPIEELTGFYSLILANLRVPTLLNLYSTVEKITKKKASIIFSGLLEDETNCVLKKYEKLGFFLIEKRSEKGWSALWVNRG